MNAIQNIENDTIPKSLLLASCEAETMFWNSNVSTTSNLPYQYHFGMPMPGRNMNSGNYRYGFNGKEKDDEHTQGKYDFGARIYDSRLGKFISVDPRYRDFSSISPYCFAANKPIVFIDENGEGPLSFIMKIAAWWHPNNQVSSLSLNATAKIGVELGTMGIDVSGGLAMDGHGNYALFGSQGMWAESMGHGVSTTANKGGYLNNGSWFHGIDIGVGVEAAEFNGLNHVKQISDNAVENTLATPFASGGIINSSAKLDGEYQGESVGRGIGLSAGYGQVQKQTTVFAFTPDDIENLEDVYSDMSDGIDFFSESISVIPKWNENRTQLEIIVQKTKHIPAGGQVVVESKTAITFTVDENNEFYYSTEDVSD